MVDVAILGGGPAGCATALRLRQHAPHRSIALIEANPPSRVRIGETLAPPAQELLKGLGVWDEFVEQGHVASYGIRSTWSGDGFGDDDFVLTPFARGWHLDRCRFDEMLLEVAENRGIEVYRNSRFVRAASVDAGWELKVRCCGEAKSLSCSFVVDASGRRADFATGQGARWTRDDSMVGGCCFFTCRPDTVQDTRLILEPVRHGWWYSTILPEGRAVAVLMTDSDIARKLELSIASHFQSALEETIVTRTRFVGALPEGAPRMVSARSGRLSRVCGDRWVAVGDAAAALDPLSGQGILKAMTNGIHGAYAIADWLGGDARGLDRYGEGVAQSYEHYLDLKDAYYGFERRWSDSSFWSRRQPRITLNPHAHVVLRRAPDERLLGLRGRVLGEIGRLGGPAHEIVRRVNRGGPSDRSDRRTILALQRLLESGYVDAYQDSPTSSPRDSRGPTSHHHGK